jgi:hypothetical protein
MDADLDLLLIAVYCTADDFLPRRAGNARRRISDTEIVTLCVAQSMMGMPSDPRFLRAAQRQVGHLFPCLPERTAFHKRRLRLSVVIEALITEFARLSPGFVDDVLLVDSTPVECARSRETVKRGGDSSLGDALSNAADYGYCASHSRNFWGSCAVSGGRVTGCWRVAPPSDAVKHRPGGWRGVASRKRRLCRRFAVAGLRQPAALIVSSRSGRGAPGARVWGARQRRS